MLGKLVYHVELQRAEEGKNHVIVKRTEQGIFSIYGLGESAKDETTDAKYIAVVRGFEDDNICGYGNSPDSAIDDAKFMLEEFLTTNLAVDYGLLESEPYEPGEHDIEIVHSTGLVTRGMQDVKDFVV